MTQKELLIEKEKLLSLMCDLGISEKTIHNYSQAIARFIVYLDENGLVPTFDCLTLFLEDLKANSNDLSQNQYHLHRRTISKFLFYLENGSFTFKNPLTNHEICGGMAQDMNDFLDQARKHLSKETIRGYQHVLRLFNEYLKENDSTLSAIIIQDFFVTLKKKGLSTSQIYHFATVLKKFFNYLKEMDFDDYAIYVPKVKYIHEQKLPSYFSAQEIKAILDSIERSSDTGKRNYAMILLAIRYGLRAHDITNLRFENIDWQNNELTIEQSKTGRIVKLPLLAEVGNALLDYLKNARRDSELPFVFISLRGPIKALTSSALYNSLAMYLSKANIKDLDKRRHGPHALRHSLATRLLENGASLHTISEVLGHSSSEVTSVYLSIDIDGLRACALKMPPLTSPIYTKENK